MEPGRAVVSDAESLHYIVSGCSGRRDGPACGKYGGPPHRYARRHASVTCKRCLVSKEWRKRAAKVGLIPHAWVTAAMKLLAKHGKTEADVLWVANRTGSVRGSWALWVEVAQFAPSTGDVIVGDGWWIAAASFLSADFEDSVVWQWREPPVYVNDAQPWLRDMTRVRTFHGMASR
jgi:hypothetical protein